MPQIQLLTRTRVGGEVTRIRFQNPDTGFCVIDILANDEKEITACGVVPGCAEGQTLEADGHFEKHETFGLRFRISEARIVPPSTTAGIERFLRFQVSGIGPKMASAIVQHFGKETIQILDLYPGRLCEVPKIGKRKAQAIAKAWKNSRESREDLIFLQGLGLTPAYCQKLLRCYGERTVEVVRSNPYRLAEDINGIGFLKADAVARELGFAADSVERMSAAVVFMLNNMISEGHVCSPVEELLHRTAELSSQSENVVKRGLDSAVERRLLFIDNGYCYTPYLLLAESRLPHIVARLAGSRDFSGKKLARISPRGDLVLDELQHQAIQAVFSHPLTIITGGPGVGKTTVIGEIVRRAKAAKVKLALAAPTGRAAKRMGESSGIEAKTLHRLLLFDPSTGKFTYDSSNLLKCDLLIVDEVSMLDIILAYQLFQAIPPGCSVVLVGDADQLPSVGAGRVLHDLMRSGFFHVTRLTKIFRQSAGSQIIVNAHRVNEGKLPEKIVARNDELLDFYWIEQDDPERSAELIGKLVTERIPQRFGFDPMSEIQVLCPMNRGSCGTAALNEQLSAVLNEQAAESFQFGSRIFKLGDRVMQTANNYDKNVFNGDLGRISMIDRSRKHFVVEFENSRQVEYAFDDADQLSLAYAITIHKSQGSEFPVVVLPLLTQHYMMLQRNLLYTGMTRARKLLILIGSAKAVDMAVKNIRLRPRYSQLPARLRDSASSCALTGKVGGNS